MPEIISNMQRLTAIQIEQHGLTMLQFFILIRLFQENKEQKVSDISQSFDLPASSMTEMLDKLEKASLIKRNRSKDDRRVVLVETTKKTEQLHNNLARANLHFVNEILSKLTEKEKQTALKIFNVLHEYSRKLTEELYKYEEK